MNVRLLWIITGLLLSQMGAAQTRPAAERGVDQQRAAWEVRAARSTAYAAARQLEEEGGETKTVAAFQAYLAIPAGEGSAARLARRDPAKFLPLVEQAVQAGGGNHRGALMVRGELLLMMGNKAGALQAYREVAALLAGAGRGPGPAGAPSNVSTGEEYMVEPPQGDNGGLPTGLVMAFEAGPGSHRDNWLIRRFIALEAWDDADREFARVRAIHQQDAGSGQYSAQGLQFAIDYAFFLEQQKRPEDALHQLEEVLLRVDLDRRPAYAREGAGRGIGGLSRKEFVRLGYGAFKTEGKEGALIAAVQTQINAGNNASRRLLARLLLQQQKTDAALAMELEYIEKGEFNALTAAVRRGQAYEDFKKLPEAAAEYEKALALPGEPVRLPDADEPEAMAARPMQQAQFQDAGGEARGDGGGAAIGNAPAVQRDLLRRLQRLYSAMGKTDQLLAVILRQLEGEDTALTAQALEQAAAAFKAAGQEERFVAWAKARAQGVRTPVARANLYAIVGDTPKLLAALAELAKAGELRDYTYDQWRQRMEGLGEGPLRQFLTAVVEASPRHARARLDLLNLERNLEGPAAIDALEAILESDAAPAFGRYKGAYNPTEFRSYFDLGYRLMRLYEKAGQIEKLEALGLRMARGDRPFLPVDPHQYDYREANDAPELANASLALAMAHADARGLGLLAKALENSPWKAARAQVERVRGGGFTQPAATKPFSWANVPAGVRLLASNENVLSLARDGEHLFAGQPWGIAVYTLDGTPLTRVALGDAALHLCAMGDAVWVGGAMGLYRVDLKTWAVSYMACDQDEPNQNDMKDFYNGVSGLARDGDVLWIGTRRNVRNYDPKTNELRIFSQDDLGMTSHADWGRFVFDADYVWAASDAGVRRYDRRTGLWEAPAAVGDQPVKLLGMIDGQLWGEVWLNDQLRARPALIDRKTLAVTPVLIESEKATEMINGPWSFMGHYQGAILFSAHDAAAGYVYDARAKKLTPLPQGPNNDPIAIDTPIPAGLRSANIREMVDGTLVATDDMTHLHEVYGQSFNAGHWVMLKLPNGNWILGGSHSRSPRYRYPREDWPFAAHVYQTPDGSGGLHLLTAEGRRRHLSAGFEDTLLGDNVFAAVPEGDRTWLCTEYGLDLLDAAGEGGGKVAGHYTMADGLLGNRIASGAVLGGKVYFATRHDDAAGGLIVLDPKTSLFTSLLESDGLATDALESVERVGDALKLTYGVQYRRYGDARYQLHPPGTYTPATGVFSPRGEPAILEQNKADAIARGPVGEPPPLLGGYLLARQAGAGGTTLLCGTRGVVILKDGVQSAALDVKTMTPKIVLSRDALQRQEAQKIAHPIGVEELRQRIADPNPYVVAEALAAAMQPVADNSAPHIALVASCLKHPHRQVRSTALLVLAQTKSPAVLAPMREAAGDRDPALRAQAAVELARLGELADVAIYEDVLMRRDGYGNLPYGAQSAIGSNTDHEAVYTALAPLADAKVFELFLRHPPRLGDYDHETTVYPQLGAALRRHPEALPALLKANSAPADGESNREFAWRIIGLGGKEMLPALYEALKSQDRVVRHNAARACGIVHDPAAIRPLLAALDLESGLSRGGIVWALGELKAVEAVPALAELYIDARNDARRRAGSGFRAAQAAAVMQEQYQSLRNLEAIGAEWDELKAAARPRALDPAGNEPLLTPELILEAVRKIGPGVAQEFYRALAGEKDTEGRLEAARQLDQAPEREKNVPILKNLLADADWQVRLAAGVSLVHLGETTGRDPILAALGGTDLGLRQRAIEELPRAKGSLDFARREIEACAADQALPERTRARAAELLR